MKIFEEKNFVQFAGVSFEGRNKLTILCKQNLSTFFFLLSLEKGKLSFEIVFVQIF